MLEYHGRGVPSRQSDAKRRSFFQCLICALEPFIGYFLGKIFQVGIYFYIFNQIPLPYIDSHFSESNKTYFHLILLQYNFVYFKKTIDMIYLEKDSFIKEIIFLLVNIATIVVNMAAQHHSSAQNISS